MTGTQEESGERKSGSATTIQVGTRGTGAGYQASGAGSLITGEPWLGRGRAGDRSHAGSPRWRQGPKRPSQHGRGLCQSRGDGGEGPPGKSRRGPQDQALPKLMKHEKTHPLWRSWQHALIRDDSWPRTSRSTVWSQPFPRDASAVNLLDPGSGGHWRRPRRPVCDTLVPEIIAGMDQYPNKDNPPVNRRARRRGVA